MPPQQPSRTPRELNDEQLHYISQTVQDLNIHDLREFISRKKGPIGALTGKKKLDSLETAYECCIKVAAALFGQIVVDSSLPYDYNEAVTKGYERLSQVRENVLNELTKYEDPW